MAKAQNQAPPESTAEVQEQATPQAEQALPQAEPARSNPFAKSQKPVWVIGLGKPNLQGALAKGERKLVLPEVAELLIESGEAELEK